MLYTRKEIERIYSELIAKYINDGARIDFGKNNYLRGGYDCHIDFLLKDNTRMVLFIRTGSTNNGFYRYDRGVCNICITSCKPVKYGKKIWYNDSDEEEKVLYSFYRFKEIYTDSKNEYDAMVAKEKKRLSVQYEYEKNLYRLNYNPIFLKIARQHDGYKRIKAENIDFVEKRCGRYIFYINKDGKRKQLIIG